MVWTQRIVLTEPLPLRALAFCFLLQPSILPDILQIAEAHLIAWLKAQYMPTVGTKQDLHIAFRIRIESAKFHSLPCFAGDQ